MKNDTICIKTALMASSFILKLRNGGVIVSSKNCSEMEISQAKVHDNFFIDDNQFGYIYFPKK